MFARSPHFSENPRRPWRRKPIAEMAPGEIAARVNRLTLLVDLIRLVREQKVTLAIFAERVAGSTQRHGERLVAELKDLAREFGLKLETVPPPKLITHAPGAWTLEITGDQRGERWVEAELDRLQRSDDIKAIARWHRQREASLREKGLCTVCEEPHAGPGPICPGCAERLNEMRGEKILARRLAGMCQECGEVPPEEGFLFCRTCLDIRNLARQRIRESRSEQGLCWCGKEPALPGLLIGAECKKQSSAQRERLYAERRAAGECVFCGTKSPDTAICASCRARSQQSREARIEQGKCPECGAALEPGFRACNTCREKKRDYLRGLRAERREQGLCIDCGEPALPGKPRCAPHAERARQASLDYSRRKAEKKRRGEA